ncbi:HdeD family acid-resistance protein [Ferrimonas marina]|uniref:Uncharacterized membrane protein HdeD, DUF308 family n=1 Tax=Ferrimonas marina TaxID=299255 RepID=A0A1M5XD06_9GAMM|nr:DUF308 domain-containing protein [Ferrimonas marina]SHH97656.1 Uncharacterized membrane protein HdeD, DUF308 family [Ferrimonas marina]
MESSYFGQRIRFGKRAGIVMVVLGLLSIAMPLVTGLALEWLMALALAVAGISQLAVAIHLRATPSFGFRLALGLLTLLAGIYLWLNPGAGLALAALLLGLYFLVDGITTLVLGRQHQGNRGLATLNGVITLCLAAIILWQWPASSRYVIGILIGVKLMLVGLTFYTAAKVFKAAGEQMAEAVEEARFAQAKTVQGEDRPATGGAGEPLEHPSSQPPDEPTPPSEPR